MTNTPTWKDAKLELNRLAHEMAELEFVRANERTPETLEELQLVWRRQSELLKLLRG